MSGSAKKRREKARQRVRRWRNRHTWFRFNGDEFVAEQFGVLRREASPIRGHVRIGDRKLPTEILPVSSAE